MKRLLFLSMLNVLFAVSAWCQIEFTTEDLPATTKWHQTELLAMVREPALQKERERAMEAAWNGVTTKSFYGTWVDDSRYMEPTTVTFYSNGTLTMVLRKGSRTNLGDYNCWVDIDVTISNIRWSFKNETISIVTSSACRVSTKVNTDLSSMTAAEKSRARLDIAKLEKLFSTKMRQGISYYSGKYKLLSIDDDSFSMQAENTQSTIYFKKK